MILNAEAPTEELGITYMNVIIDWKIIHDISASFESLLANCFPLSLLKKKMFYPLSLWSHFSQRGCCVYYGLQGCTSGYFAFLASLCLMSTFF